MQQKAKKVWRKKIIGQVRNEEMHCGEEIIEDGVGVWRQQSGDDCPHVTVKDAAAHGAQRLASVFPAG